MRKGRERRMTFRKRERRMNGRVEESEDEKERRDYLRKMMTTRKQGRSTRKEWKEDKPIAHSLTSRQKQKNSLATKKEGSN